MARKSLRSMMAVRLATTTNSGYTAGPRWLPSMGHSSGTSGFSRSPEICQHFMESGVDIPTPPHKNDHQRRKDDQPRQRSSLDEKSFPHLPFSVRGGDSMRAGAADHRQLRRSGHAE